MELYRSHVESLDCWRNVIMNRLSIARRPYSISDSRQTVLLERLLVGLEKDKRDVEMDCWQDMKEIEHKGLELKFDYQATADRLRLLGGLRWQYDGESQAA